MFTTPLELRMFVGELSNATWTLASMGVLYDSGLAEQLREPRSLDELAAGSSTLTRSGIERCLAVVVTTGAVMLEAGRYRLSEGAKCYLQEPMRSSLRGDIRSQLMQTLAYLDAASHSPPKQGWYHTDPALLQAQGDGSAGLAPMLKMMALPQLGDLAARLEQPGARFLDIGVGVGALAISMARVWPGLHTVGLDVREAPLALARQNVARAQLGDRIELRQLGIEQLADQGSFDLAWLPSFFIPQAAMAEGAARVRAALRPGGWVILCVIGGGDDRQRAVLGLINELWGGPTLSPVEAEQLLTGAGLSGVRTLPGPAQAPKFVVGQRAS